MLLFFIVSACNMNTTGFRQSSFKAELDIYQKSKHFQAVNDREFMNPEGWLCYKKPVNFKGVYSDDYKDQTSLTCMQVMAEVHRYKASKSMDAIYNLDKLINGIEKIFSITNLSGYPARAIAQNDEVDIEWKWRGVSPELGLNHPLADYHWKGKTGKLEFASLILCLSETCIHIKDFPKIVERSRKLLIKMASYLLLNFQQIRGVNGQINVDGDLTGQIVVVPMLLEFSAGFNHLISLAIYSAAFDHCQDEKLKLDFVRGIRDLVQSGVINNLNPVTNYNLASRNYVNDNIAFLTARVLLDSPNFKYKNEVLYAINKLWKGVRKEKNIFWYSLVRKHVKENDAFEKTLVDQLRFYPDQKISVSVDFSKNRELRFFNSDLDERVSKKSLDLNQRPISAFIWSSNPYVTQKYVSQSQAYSPVDYLSAFWLARSENIIRSSE